MQTSVSPFFQYEVFGLKEQVPILSIGGAEKSQTKDASTYPDTPEIYFHIISMVIPLPVEGVSVG
jgi:hypothetical protein